MTPISQVESPVVALAVPRIAEEDRLTGVLRPAGYRLLVEIVAPENSPEWLDRTTQMPDEVRDREWAAQMWAVVLELGPEAYQDEKRFRKPWCQPGDVILMRPYSGTRFMLRGHLYGLINDDTVQAVANDTRGMERA